MTIGNHINTFTDKDVVDFTIESDISNDSNKQNVVYRLTQEYEAEESQRELFDHFFQQIDPAKLSALVIGSWEEAFEDGPDGFIEALIDKKDELTNLTALFIGEMTYEECEISWIKQTDYTPLLNAFPKLRELCIRGSSDLELSSFNHDHLEKLTIQCGGLPVEIVNALEKSSLPALTHLELWLGTEGYGFSGNATDYANLLTHLDKSKLSYLGLKNAEIADDIAVWLAQQAWLEPLETLDLSMGTLSDVGAQALFASPHVSKLKKLDLTHHFISDAWQNKLAGLDCDVVLADRQEEDSYDDEIYRFVAVSE